MASRCDIIRDAVEAAACGLCGQTPGPNCPARLSPALCALPRGANARMRLFAGRLSAAPLLGGVRAAAQRLAQADYAADVASAEAALGAAYPGAAPGAASIGWEDFGRCLAAGGGYLGRGDAELAGLAPPYPLGGRLALGRVWGNARRGPAPVPLGADYLLNPDLLTLFLLALLLGAAALAAYGFWKKRRPAAFSRPRAHPGPAA